MFAALTSRPCKIMAFVMTQRLQQAPCPSSAQKYFWGLHYTNIRLIYFGINLGYVNQRKNLYTAGGFLSTSFRPVNG